ncbi:N-acetylmuramoyl-L-alanine amidase [Aliidongia dinghuensis]|uniref:N-acetylmuramoyl-L-alanine amidase n=1 Tax=Aliidongia dinghuensis TaxID=1867774 RepID=A0A8J2YUE0_9PROT|nr:N-acetylmuramoyl-L-alanine amidase [Aliidongia dinghuensis]GGF17525.1 N-acetylmuramoyl-L-alanine amidase [Aliidongia dinghuensis]
MKIIERPSPNFEPRSAPVDILLLHYTGMATAEAALERLSDPVARVSCHWLIDEDGTVYRMVDETMRAWHAGLSFWAGERDVNGHSIGIELVNPGHEWGYRPFPPAQMAALAELAAGILARHAIQSTRVLGHSDVAPERKQDPGELFDWAWLAARGIGLWPAADAPAMPVTAEAGLLAIGYEAATPATVTAFQRRYRPGRIDGVIDPETARRVGQVAFAHCV